MSRSEYIPKEADAVGRRTPPHSVEGERGVLGCCLLDPRERIAECVAAGLTPAAFYVPRHGIVFGLLMTMAEEQELVDLVTVPGRLAARPDHAPDEGWHGWLDALMEETPSAANLPQYRELVWSKYLLRRMLWSLSEQMTAVESYAGGPGGVGEVLDTVEAEVLNVNRLGGASKVARGMYELVNESQARIETMRRGVGLLSGLRTHFAHLDKWTAGLHTGEMVVIAARPSLGKTSLAMCLARNLAVQERIPVGVFSMEMSDEQLVTRMLCAEARVDSHKLRTGFPSNEELERLVKAGVTIGKAKIFVDDTASLGILELKARARRMVAQQGVRMIVVDYLQLMHGSMDYRGNRTLEVTEISNGLRSLGKELKVAMVVLSQLNRETERNKSRKPQLADLRESGAIEQDADTVLMLYKPKSKDDDDEGKEIVRVNVLIAKQRNGPSDWDVEFLFHKKYTRFEDAHQNLGHLPAQDSAPTEPERDTELPSPEEMFPGK